MSKLGSAKKKILKINFFKKYSFSLFIIIPFLLAISWGVYSWITFLNQPLLSISDTSVKFLYPQGTPLRILIANLERRGLVKDPLFFLILAHLNGSWRNLHAGEYLVIPGTKPNELLRQMTQGEAVMQSFTVVEGWDFKQILSALNANPHVVHTTQNLSTDEVMRLIGHEGEFPEGRFAADTYLFHTGIKDTTLLKLSYNLLEERLKKAWDKRASGLPYKCSYQALIAASIIEKESNLESDRPKVAGVIVRRLQKGMYLNMDSTVTYGMGNDYTKKLTKADLEKNTPYNSYLHRGLSPTPISMPSYSSIDAALHPAAGEALYFFDPGNGKNIFSNDLKDHEAAVKKYLK